MELIPGFPNDVARDCLVRVSYKELSSVASVCKAWKDEVESPAYRRLRRESCRGQKVVVMAQARVVPGQSSSVKKFRPSPAYVLTVLQPETGNWCRLPPVPGFSLGLPMFCQVASVGSSVVVLGGLDPVTWEVSEAVFVFDFVAATWRRGADMPGVRRSFFGSTSDCDRTVYVAGGHDAEKNALRSAMAYDVVTDEWVPLPDMARERDECKAIFNRGKLHVIGGYCTEMQGRFETSAEVFDVAAWEWADVREDFLGAATCPRTCVCGDNGDVYMCREGDVAVLRGTAWQTVAQLPSEMCNTSYVTTWQNKLLVIGSARFGEPHVAYVLDLKTCKWTKIETPGEYSGHVQSGCFMEI